MSHKNQVTEEDTLEESVKDNRELIREMLEVYVKEGMKNGGNSDGKDDGITDRDAGGIIDGNADWEGDRAAGEMIREYLDQIRANDPEEAEKWSEILKVWDETENLVLNEGVAPDGLDTSDALCFVVLGFQLNPDGSMKDELIGRMEVAKKCADQYPNALIACTGGGTAANNEKATEADAMAGWLIKKGIDSDRILIENQSLTTAQNAMFTLEHLRNEHPEVKDLVIVSSDYHINTGALFYEADSILNSGTEGDRIHVVSNAAFPVGSVGFSRLFEAAALLELAGDFEGAGKLYSEVYPWM